MATLEAAFTGAVASSLANIAVYPLDLAKTLVQTQLKTDKSESDDRHGEEKTTDRHVKYKNALDCIYKVYMERGFGGLYRGMSTAVIGNFIQTFCYFFWYTLVRKYYFKIKLLKSPAGGKIAFSTIEELTLGVIAAATSQLFTNPISIISTRQQTIESDADAEDSKLSNVVRQIFKEHNGDITGFWKGLKVSLVLTINPAITYTCYQKLRTALFSVEEFSKNTAELSAGQNFLLGVVSKMISTVITQPLIVSKASLQRSGSKFCSFQESLLYLYKNEGLIALWKGLKPQLVKGILVQGLLFMFKGELSKGLRRLIFLYSNLFISHGRGKNYNSYITK